MSSHPSRTCYVCRRPLGQRPPSELTCGDPACRLAHQRQQMSGARVGSEISPEAMSREEFRRQLQVVRERWEEECLDPGGDALPGASVTALPLFRVPLSPLPESRRREFEKYLVSLLDRVRERVVGSPGSGSEAPSEPASASPSIPPDAANQRGDRMDWRDPPFIGEAGEALSVKLCSACRGHCCQQGGTHAFLDRERLEEILALSPGRSRSELVESYLGFLPDRTFQDSCVFHGETGCGLPREMRGFACNRHFCWGARRIRDAVAKGEEPRAFVGFFGPDGMASAALLD